MDDEAIFQFTGITSASTAQAERYLQLTDGNLEQAVQLFFEDPSLAADQASTTATQSRQQESSLSPRPAHHTFREPGREIIQIDSDDESDVEMLDEAPTVALPDTTEDAELARQLQQEMYGGAAPDADAVQAPMSRTRVTLVGGADFEDMDDASISALVQQQILGRQRRSNGST